MRDKIAAMSAPVIQARSLDAQGVTAVVSAVGSWAILIVISRVLVVEYGVNPWALAFVQMAIGGAAMIAAAGRGPLPLRALRRWQTWSYGVLRVMTAATFTAALAHGTAAEVSVLSALFIPIGIVLAWMVMKRPPASADVVGSAVVIAGIAGVASQLPGGVAGPASLLMMVSATGTASATDIAERHPDNQGDDSRGRLRLSGAALLATAAVMLAVTVAAAHFDPAGAVAAHVPVEAVFDPLVWISGILIGVVLRGPSTYATFRAIRMVGSENYLMGVAIMPGLNLAGETLAASAGLLPMPSLSDATVTAGIICVAGALGIAAARWRRRLAIG